jgi:hypothetical protein
MSNDFKKVLVKDSRLMVSDQVSYAVLKGGQNMTCQRFNAIGSSPFTSNINFNLQIPSQETVVSRNVLMTAQLEFTISGATVATGPADSNSQTGVNYLFHYGGSDCFGPLVFNQLITSQQYTINNTTVSQNTRDILAVILRMHDKRWLSRYNGMTPSAFDTYFKAPPMAYTEYLIPTLNNPAAGFAGTSMDNDLLPRGAFPLDSISCTLADGVTGSNNYLAAGTARIVTVRITVTEPVLISPFTFAGDDGQGFYGIQNLSAIINLDQTANTAIRFGGVLATRFGTGAAGAVVLPTVRFTGAYVPQLLFQLLTPHASDLFPARNVVPYYELPRYITTCPAIAAGGSVTITSQSLQLNMIPDKLLISVGKPISLRTPGDSDSWLAITGISINWNNTSGLLSSATPQDLWRMSTENGVNQTWSEFRGFAQSYPYSAAGQGLSQVQTCGSVLCLEFGTNIQLSEDYYSASSLGNFQLQFNVTVQNMDSANAIPANAYQLLTVVQNSGIFSIERGVSSSYLGVLTKSDVLEASRQEASGYSSALRMVGGAECPSQFSRLKATMGKIQGKGESGGMSSGMGMSAGKKHKGKMSMGALEDRL